MKNQNQKTLKLDKKSLILLLIVVASYLILNNQVSELSQASSSISEANVPLVLAGVVLTVAGIIAATVSYKALILRQINFSRLFVIQLAGTFSNKLLPAGTGSLATNIRFLSKTNHTIVQASAVSAVNNLMGFSAHLTLLFVGFLVYEKSLDDLLFFESDTSTVLTYTFVSLIFSSVALLYTLPSFRKRTVKIFKSVRKSLNHYRKHPEKLLCSFLASVSITLSYITVLYLSAVALNLELSFLQCLLVFSVGISTSTITPTPGGIIGAEAGLVAALSASGLPTEDAISLTLLYRLITYWLPIIPGFLAFRYALRRDFI